MSCKVFTQQTIDKIFKYGFELKLLCLISRLQVKIKKVSCSQYGTPKRSETWLTPMCLATEVIQNISSVQLEY